MTARWLDDELEEAFHRLEHEALRRKCAVLGHQWINVTSMDHFCQQWMCRHCGEQYSGLPFARLKYCTGPFPSPPPPQC